MQLRRRHAIAKGPSPLPERYCESYCCMPTVNKRDMSERDICTKFITPAVQEVGWDLISQIREEVCFTKGRIIVRGKLVTRGKAERRLCPVLQAQHPDRAHRSKGQHFPPRAGMQQGLDYATPVNIPLGFQLAPSLCLCPLLATLLFSLTGDRL